MVEILGTQEAARRLDILNIGAVRSDRWTGELLGIITSIKPSDHDIHFTCCDGPDATPHLLRLGDCEVAPLMDGKPNWDYAFTIASLRDFVLPACITAGMFETTGH